MRGLSITILVLALVGIGLSLVSTINHYRTDPTSYCSFDENFNCDIVNRSIYSRFPANSRHAVPVAIIGLAGYAGIAVLAAIRRRTAAALLLAVAASGLAFSLYLTYIEARILHVWCILCLGSLAVIALITFLSAARLARRQS